jgi:Leucine Rich repeat
MEALGQALTRNNTLEYLGADRNRFGKLGLTLLAANLKNNTGLTALCMAGSSIDDVGAAVMAGLLAINTPLTVLKVDTSLRYLDLRKNKIGKRRQSQMR